MKLSSQALLLFILFIYVLPVTASASRPKVDEYCKVDYFSKTNAGTYKGQCIDNTPYGPGIVEFYNGDMIEGYFKDVTVSGNFFNMLGEIELISNEIESSSDHSLFTPKILFSNLMIAGS